MRILVIKTYPHEIDTQSYNCQELELPLAMCRSGQQCDVMCVTPDGRDKEDIVERDGHRVTVYYRRAICFKYNAWFVRVAAILDRYDILHTLEYNELFSWHLARKYSHKTVVYHGPYHTEDSSMAKYNRMLKVFDRLCLPTYLRHDTPFVTKSRLAEQFLRHRGITNVTSVGVGTEPLTVQPVQTDVARQLLSRIQSAPGIKLLYVGVVGDRKNSAFLLEVLRELQSRHVEATLVVVGRCQDDRYRRMLSATTSLIYEPTVAHCDMLHVYRACDIFLFPTLYDIYGMVLLEAMGSGLPVISTLCGGSQMMIDSGTNGFLSHTLDVALWADTITQLAADPARAAAIGRRAASTISQHFTWDALCPQFLSVYNTLLHRA